MLLYCIYLLLFCSPLLMGQPSSSGGEYKSKRGRAALTSPACGYQWRLIYWGMDGLMQLSVSSQASHLWICFSTVWPSVLLQPADKHRDDGEGISSFSLWDFCCQVDVFSLPNATCFRQDPWVWTYCLLFGSGEQLKWSCHTMGGHYDLIDT